MVRAHPMVDDYLPVVEGHVEKTTSFVFLNVKKGYAFVYDLAPEQFKLVEEGVLAGCDSLKKVANEHITPCQRIGPVFKFLI